METPWQRVFAKFGMTQSDFARAIGRHRAKISRALKDDRGLLSGEDVQKVLDAARAHDVTITPEDIAGHDERSAA